MAEEDGEEKAYPISTYKTIWPFIRPYRFQYLAGFFCLLFVDASQVLIPQVMRRIIDTVSAGVFVMGDVIPLAALMVACMTLVSIGRFFWRFFINGSARRIEKEVRDRIFEHLLTLSWDYFQKNKNGDLMARSTNDLGQLRNAIGNGMVTLLDTVFMAAAILVIIIIQDARSALLAVIPLVPITVMILLSAKMTGKMFERANEAVSDMSDTVQETFAGVRVVKSFVKEWWFTKRFTGNNDDLRKSIMGLVKIFGIFFPLVTLLAQISNIILIVIGGRRVVLGLMSPGELVSLFSYIQMLIWPLMGAGFMVNMIRRGAVSLGRINEILDSKPSIKQPETPETAPFDAENPVIEIRGMSFAWKNSYSGEDESDGGEKKETLPVLENISLKIAAGTALGILGPTGSGKSTLVKTITRMADPPPDTVFIHGIPAAGWDVRELRGLFGMVPQDSYLFSDSIKNNIAYGISVSGNDDGGGKQGGNRKTVESRIAGSGENNSAAGAIPEDTLKDAARRSAIDLDLPNFAEGWETTVGERGLTLSGGQKQRVAIARALAVAPEILILDDALSAVDAETERRIVRFLLEERRARRESGGGGITIIVSHRISTLMNADRVIVLEKGKITEDGPPAALARRGGFFARMAAMQQHEIEDAAAPGGRESATEEKRV